MTHSDSRVAVYTGSFDPVTLGHLNVIQRAARLVDTLIVGVGINTEKAPLFSPEQRIDLLQHATAHIKNVDVRGFSGLAVTFVRECNARVMVRGVRPLTGSCSSAYRTRNAPLRLSATTTSTEGATGTVAGQHAASQERPFQ